MQMRVVRGRRVGLLIVEERSRRILVRKDFRNRVAAIRAKARSELLV